MEKMVITNNGQSESSYEENGRLKSSSKYANDSNDESDDQQTDNNTDDEDYSANHHSSDNQANNNGVSSNESDDEQMNHHQNDSDTDQDDRNDNRDDDDDDDEEMDYQPTPSKKKPNVEELNSKIKHHDKHHQSTSKNDTSSASYHNNSSSNSTRVKKEKRISYREDSDSDVDYEDDNEEEEDEIEEPKSSKKNKSLKRAADSDDDELEEEYSSKKKKKKDSPTKSSKKEKKKSKKESSVSSSSTSKSKSKEKDKKKKDKDKKDKKKDKDKKKSSSKSGKKELTSPTKGKKKKEEDTEHIWKWWEEMGNQDASIKWKTLSHNGPVFAPAYEPLPSHVKFYYDGKVMKLQPKAEEIATFYGRMIDHEYTSKKQFNDNFFHDWKKYMNPDERDRITDLKKCNFTEIDKYFKEQSEIRKSRTKEEKFEAKQKEDEIRAKYGWCTVDGHKQQIGNFKIEPPGLFRGRGEHPKMGKVKGRIEANDIIINIGKEATVPEPPKGQRWKEVRHDNTVTWLASWTENIMGSVKYIMLNPTSKLKSQKDWQKYEKARELKKCVKKIRKDYEADFKAKEMVKRQRAVALYFIDKLALRADNEKEEGETAVTVGCCSLRYEHIKLHSEKDGQKYVVDFDFLGKDSIRYQNSVPVEKQVYKSLKKFMDNKSEGDDLFDRLNTSTLNKYLNSLMDGLTAKVFRTYNASQTLQEQLDKLTDEDSSLEEKVLSYNRANRAVAILCNHQRSVPKTFDKAMENLQAKISEKQKQIKDTRKELKEAKKDRDSKTIEKASKKLERFEQQLKKLEVSAVDKEENKQIALGTSKLNYLDPRISVAWCQKHEVPIERVYNKTQREKFRWAIEMATSDYKF